MIQVENQILQDKLYYNDVLLLSYKIEYPKFSDDKYQPAVHRMNRYYKTKAEAYQLYCRQKLAREAINQYEYAQQNGFPFNAYEALLVYEVTYNENSIVSLYFDQYEYTGGAHGNTVRSSETWSLKTGRQIPLKKFFPQNANYRAYIIENINEQIKQQIASGENYYFEDYEKNVAKYFDPTSYYLTAEGIVIYFQQYEIAPYSSGIPQFVIPYQTAGVLHPSELAV